jgi:hypothetical protein
VLFGIREESAKEVFDARDGHGGET